MADVIAHLPHFLEQIYKQQAAALCLELLVTERLRGRSRAHPSIRSNLHHLTVQPRGDTPLTVQPRGVTPLQSKLSGEFHAIDDSRRST
jgi:predicted dienelactone hydrolase